MDFFGILTMIGGLALFLYGMTTMSQSLEKLTGGRLQRILEQMTSTTFRAILLGAAVTAVVQSSSATTVMVVGFVNSGIMNLNQAVGIIMGANIGTTITSWILSLTGIQSTNFFIQLLKPSSFAPVFALVGVALLMFAKKDRQKDIGSILLGFAVLMTGMETMSDAVKPLADVPEFMNMFTLFSNPLLGMLAGALLTGIIQSSAATLGILQALSATGAITYGSVIPIILGAHIGTCVTAMLSSVGASKNARRAALIHLYFNVIAMGFFMIVFYALNAVFHFEFLDMTAMAVGIAAIHSVISVAATIILLPFRNLLVKLACLTIPDEKEEPSPEEEYEAEYDEALRHLDERFIQVPGYAVEQCRILIVGMANLVEESMDTALDLIFNYSEDSVNHVYSIEGICDRYEGTLGAYFVKLAAQSLSKSDSQQLSLYLHCIGDFERISDHALKLAESANELHEKNLKFSEKAVKDLEVYTSAVREIVSISIRAFETDNVTLASEAEPLNEVIKELNKVVKADHIERLQSGECSVEAGFIMSDITTNLERVSDHCSVIAISLIEVGDEDLDTHTYRRNIRRENRVVFLRQLQKYREKYLSGRYSIQISD